MAGKHTNNNSGNKLFVSEASEGETDQADSFTEQSQFLDERNSPGAVGTIHRFSDLDSSQFAQHHTLGPRHNQASPGDHIHDGVSSRNIGAWTLLPAAISNASWTAATTNPSLGSGATEGKYTKIGTTVTYRFSLVCAANTTFGTGAWLFKLPFTAVLPSIVTPGSIPGIGIAHGFQGGTANYVGAVNFSDADHVTIVSHAVANAWQSNTPVAWAANANNFWGFEITYESIK